MEHYNSMVDAIAAAGFGAPHIIHDKQIHRFTHPDDKPNSNNCWYVSFGTAGKFGSWKLGFDQVWSDGKSENNDQYLAEIREYQRQREADQEIIWQDTSLEALELWQSAAKPVDHPYPVDKQITPYSARQANNLLLVPMFWNGALWNVQRIYPDGMKLFMKGGRVTGCYCHVGVISDHLLICEGWATACSLHEHTGSPIIVAFYAGNLLPVARAVRKRYPDTRITIAADNDTETEKKHGTNPGLEKARQAAAAVGGDFIYPSFDSDGLSDFNDYVNAGGTIILPEEEQWK